MKIRSKLSLVSLIAIFSLLTGCMTAGQHYEQTHGAQERKMTVGTVQKEIKNVLGGLLGSKKKDTIN